MSVVIHSGQVQTVIRILEYSRLTRAALELSRDATRRVLERKRRTIEFRRIVDQRVAVIEGADWSVRAGAGPAGCLIDAQPRGQNTAEILRAAYIGFRHGVDHRDDLPAGVERAKRPGRADCRKLVEDRGRARRIELPELAVRGVERALQLERDLVAGADVLASLQAPETGIDSAVLELIDMPQVTRVRQKGCGRG